MNYTQEQTNELVEAYKAEPTEATVAAFAAKFGKTTRSIVAKLAQAQVYVAKKADAKAKVVTKAELITKIAADLGQDATKLATLEKASKEALQILADNINAV